ncbi:hypothetical protein BSFA1_41840 [Burkholderia sp. SFA1]|nr:hypothetical protein BSFA1_41840 [Burkholderia sp. SFA1]
MEMIRLIRNQIRHHQMPRRIGLADLAVLVQHRNARYAVRRDEGEGIVDTPAREHVARHQHDGTGGVQFAVGTRIDVRDRCQQVAVAAAIRALRERLLYAVLARALNLPAEAAAVVGRLRQRRAEDRLAVIRAGIDARVQRAADHEA